MPKRSLRMKLLAQRRALDPDLWRSASHSAQLKLLSLDEYANAECVALYASAHNEIDTGLILADALRMGKRVLFPAVSGHKMVFRQVSRAEDFREGAFGIPEPCPIGGELQAGEADLIVVPGVAFDLSGHRVGYGKGFYDRFLHHPDCRACLVGLCHDFQLIEGIIHIDLHDIPMDIIVTEKRIIPMIDCDKKRSDRSSPRGPDLYTGG